MYTYMTRIAYKRMLFADRHISHFAVLWSGVCYMHIYGAHLATMLTHLIFEFKHALLRQQLSYKCTFSSCGDISMCA